MQGLGLIFYGSEGIGKTSFCTRFPGPVEVLSVKETGFADLIHVPGQIPSNVTNKEIEEFGELKYCIEHTKAKSVVIDSLSGVQQILFEHVCAVVHDNQWDKFKSYWTGQRVDSPVFLQELLDISNKTRQRGTNIIFIGHMATIDVANSMGPDYMSHVLFMDDGDKGGLRSTMIKWAQGVLFMNIDISINRITNTDKNSKMITAGKAKDEETRVMLTTKSPGHSAKNRLNLPPLIPMGDSPDEAFTNFWKHVPQYYKDNITK